ncbi:hypothetical protein AA958_00395 [Streptomyces sp. CNQ-509]|uniref:GntR family transcriptional regulator n=1 Tax=unclassified Streptomyces TaxID=2593676 RepID=UPI00062DFEB6|nr:GntR family transcriptional regulator [Streptomyces sp. CNQ-509]AKH80878.1 hypothetical protein AA958_00395 [Streptomyces sp. CNQ-509]
MQHNKPTPPSKADQVYEALLEQIGTGTLAPGVRLSEREMVERYGASRTTVRAAAARLIHEGLLERTTRGMLIQERPREQILQVYDAWALLEAAAVEQAAQAATETDLKELERLLTGHRRHDGGQGHRPDLHLKFHEALWDASHNPVLVGLLLSLNTRLLQVATSTLAQPGRWQVALDEHGKILTALRAGRGPEAAGLARDHILSAREARLEMWRNEHRRP